MNIEDKTKCKLRRVSIYVAGKEDISFYALIYFVIFYFQLLVQKQTIDILIF